MADFNKAIKKTLKFEGGYVQNRFDPGGETKYGISKRSYPNLNIKNITLDTAKKIYKMDFWDKIKGDEIQSQAIAEDIFDFAVNSGVRKAINTTQETLGLHKTGTFNTFDLNKINNSIEPIFLYKYKYFRIKYLLEICKKNQNLKRFFFGWVNRVIEI